MNKDQTIEGINTLRWETTDVSNRIRLLKQVKANLESQAMRLASADMSMKNQRVGESTYTLKTSIACTVAPVASTLSACIFLYETLLKSNKLPQPIEVKQLSNNLYDAHVFPDQLKDRILYGDRKDILRIKGKPKQVNPMDKPAGIIAVLCAGNYASPLEIIKAIFLENSAVVCKPHPLNQQTDKIWEIVFAPLIDHEVLSYHEANAGEALIKNPALTKIYFTGSAKTAQKIEASTRTPLVSECGGNNPCIIVPGIRPWTDDELAHQALQITTAAKMNGGAVCGRPQTIVTSKHWPQRQAFISALKKAICEDTPAVASYYPGFEDTLLAFSEAQPNAVTLKTEDNKHDHSDVLFIENIDEDSYAAKNEDFCQIISEVSLDVPVLTSDFLPFAVDFCNQKLIGTLSASIIIDEDTKKSFSSVLDQAVTELKYGAIAINNMPPLIFLNPYLTWGGNEEGSIVESGRGNFGNLLCFENIEKSIISSSFISAGHLMNTNKKTFDALAHTMTMYTVNPTWFNLIKLASTAMMGKFRKKDF